MIDSLHQNPEEYASTYDMGLVYRVPTPYIYTATDSFGSNLEENETNLQELDLEEYESIMNNYPSNRNVEEEVENTLDPNTVNG